MAVHVFFEELEIGLGISHSFFSVKLDRFAVAAESAKKKRNTWPSIVSEGTMYRNKAQHLDILTLLQADKATCAQ